jgi:hypothetical protein
MKTYAICSNSETFNGVISLVTNEEGETFVTKDVQKAKPWLNNARME